MDGSWKELGQAVYSVGLLALGTGMIYYAPSFIRALVLVASAISSFTALIGRRVQERKLMKQIATDMAAVRALLEARERRRLERLRRRSATTSPADPRAS